MKNNSILFYHCFHLLHEMSCDTPFPCSPLYTINCDWTLSKQVQLNLTVKALQYNTTGAYSKCNLTQGQCSLKLFFPKANAAVITSPGPEQVRCIFCRQLFKVFFFFFFFLFSFSFSGGMNHSWEQLVDCRFPTSLACHLLLSEIRFQVLSLTNK